jgi:RHS repeat-associated protein
VGTSAEGRTKFGTYQRDGNGLDYAVNRYYMPGSGRFTTPDPLGVGAADMADPASWNRFGYAMGDPINFNDPSGLTACGNLSLTSGRTLRDAALADTAQGHFISLVWHEAGFLRQAGGDPEVWGAEFALIAQAIWDRFLIVSGGKTVAGANGTIYSRPGSLGYGTRGRTAEQTLNNVLLAAAAGTNVLNRQTGALVDNRNVLLSSLNEEQGDLGYRSGRVPLMDVNGGPAGWLTQGCYSVYAAVFFADAVASGWDFNIPGTFVTSWNVRDPGNNPNYAAGVEHYFGTIGPTNFFGFVVFDDTPKRPRRPVGRPF